MDNKRHRGWVFTWNNYPKDLFTALRQENLCEAIFGKSKYIVIGFETGDSGTPHLQGYVEWVNARALGGLKKIHQAIHWEKRLGTSEEASRYCKKDGDYVEYGDLGPGQGSRSDLLQIKNEIMNGTKVDQILLEDPELYHKYGRTFNKIEDLAMRRKWRTEMTQGIWYYGRTGVGKSHTAFENYDPTTHYLYPNDNGWWDGYTQQETVIINDFRGEIPYNMMLQMIDKWPFSVRRRNREPMPFTSKYVIITSSLHPADIYHNRNDEDKIEQLLRRLHVIFLDGTRHSTEVLGGNTEPPSTGAYALTPADAGGELPDIDLPTFSGIERLPSRLNNRPIKGHVPAAGVVHCALAGSVPPKQ